MSPRCPRRHRPGWPGCCWPSRRVSHVEDIATDAGAALAAGLTSMPKATALTTYSYRLDHARQAKFLAALDKATQNNEVLAFADHWRTVSGADPKLLIFDSKVTTKAQLAQLGDRA